MLHALTLGATVFVVIFLLELPDKTAVAVLLLATRNRALPVLLGAAAAFVVQSGVAVFAGSVFGLLPHAPVRIAAGLLFLGMAALVFRRNFKQEAGKEAAEIEREERRHRSPLLTAFIVVFLAEWGDLTQLATAALEARYRQPLIVFISATLALWAVSLLAIGLGNRLGALVPQRPLQLSAAGVMTVIALALITGVLG